MTTQALTTTNPATVALAPMATVTPADVQDLARYVKAPNTLRSYEATRREFEAWRAAHCPAGEDVTPADVARYLMSLDKAGAKTATIAAKRAGVVYHYGDVARARPVRDTFDAIRRRRADRLAGAADADGARGNASVSKAALSEDHLRAMCANPPEGLGAIRDRALLLIGYYGAFRRSELVALNVEDLTFEAGGLIVRVARSKTDQAGQGATKPIPANRDRRIDPVAAVRAWLSASGIAAGAVWRGVRRGRLLAGRITAQVVALIVKREAERLGLNPDVFGAHSLRSGFVTAAGRRGVSRHTVKRVTLHKSDAMIERYDQRDTREALAELARHFA